MRWRCRWQQGQTTISGGRPHQGQSYRHPVQRHLRVVSSQLLRWWQRSSASSCPPFRVSLIHSRQQGRRHPPPSPLRVAPPPPAWSAASSSLLASRCPPPPACRRRPPPSSRLGGRWRHAPVSLSLSLMVTRNERIRLWEWRVESIVGPTFRFCSVRYFLLHQTVDAKHFRDIPH